jgi:hypothetical protein
MEVEDIASATAKPLPSNGEAPIYAWRRSLHGGRQIGAGAVAAYSDLVVEAKG